MSDIGLIWDPAKMQGDIALTGGDLFLDNPLRTAVMVSLFSDRLAPDQVSALDRSVGIQPPGTAATSELSPRRGWWGDAYEGQLIGSRLWQCERLIRANKTSVLLEVEAVIHEALDWLVAEGIASSIIVKACWSATTRGQVDYHITVQEPGADAPQAFRFGWAWQGLNAA